MRAAAMTIRTSARAPGTIAGRMTSGPSTVSPDWGKTSRRQTLAGLLYRTRMAAAVALIDDVCTSSDTVLEIGCGTGRFTSVLAARVHSVDAVGNIRAALETAGARIAALNASNVRFHLGPASRLQFPDESRDVVVALDVLPWTRDQIGALAEIARVVKPGGAVLLGVRNRFSVVSILDPAQNPLLAPARDAIETLLWGTGLRRRSFRPELPVLNSRIGMMSLLHQVGMVVTDERSTGYGPFTFFGNHVLSDLQGRKMQGILQQMSDRGAPVVRRAGLYSLYLCSKSRQDLSVPTTQ